ncbi:Fur family transcriptional regulator [Atopobacter sp. AH10]|uniref:Fur family transcriptional regulator n=1 Tax=Atopobacter sp. AH10 TaxID=2315861 RepID=UPI001F1660FE|nr:Fur family transcriptional regulator [Atopobacter sp. AH10]
MTLEETQQVVRIMKKNGYKMTDKRREIIELFAEEDRYLTAREVQERMVQRFPQLSFDTIYRNIYTLAELNVLEMTDLNGEKYFRFACSHIGHHHHHFICKKCGRTKAIPFCPMDTIEQELDGYSITGHRFEVYGLCDQCQQSSGNKI